MREKPEEPASNADRPIMTNPHKQTSGDRGIAVTDEYASKVPGKGMRIGEYTVLETLGHGAMATVYLAVDATGHEIALKVFQEGPGVSETMLERFRREAEASKKLRRHPHIMTIYATGRDGPYHYISMESIRRSKTLEDALENTPMSLNTIVQIIIKIARALQYAHMHHIVHRDVKPTNIMIDEFGEPLLSDFGVAELIDWPSCTMTGALTGTPLYMSPEQARSERVGPASDIYSLGVVLFEAVTGVLPYTCQHSAPVKEVLEAVKNEPPKRPRLFRKEISPELEAVMLKALEKNPKDRYMDAEAFAVDLERALAGRRVSAHHFSPLDHVRHLVRRHQRIILVVAPLIIAGLVSAYYYRQKLMRARYDDLLTRAQLRNALYMLAQAEGPGLASDTPRAWHEIRLARKAMTAGDWRTARNSFQAAADISLEMSDTRTAAISHLDLARCEVMLNNRDAAKQIYHRILTSTDTSPAIASLAQLEYLSLQLLEGNRKGAVEVLLLREPPPDGPIRDAMNCMSGELSPAALLNLINNMPQQFQNDAYLAVAIRYYMDGETQRSSTYLRRSITSSRPPAEWPAPFARMLHSDLSR